MLLELFPCEMHALESFCFLFALAMLLHALKKDSLCNSNTSWIPSWPEQLLIQGWLQVKLQTNSYISISPPFYCYSGKPGLNHIGIWTKNGPTAKSSECGTRSRIESG